MTAKQLPTRGQIKALIHLDMWFVLGTIFDFNPVFLLIKSSGGRKRNVIDWRCVPVAMYKILQCQDAAALKAEIESDSKRKSRGGGRAGVKRKGTKLFEFQNGKCFYCKRDTERSKFSVDHVVPLSRGGRRTKLNEVGACKTCNNTKGNMLLIDFLMSDYVKNGYHRR